VAYVVRLCLRKKLIKNDKTAMPLLLTVRAFPLPVSADCREEQGTLISARVNISGELEVEWSWLSKGLGGRRGGVGWGWGDGGFACM
jgi:hypothetical protein